MKRIILLCLCAFFLSCEFAPNGVIIETKDNTDMEEIMSREIIVNPIPDFIGYLFNPGQLKGITPGTGRTDYVQCIETAKIDGVNMQVQLTDFFTKDGKKYFSFIDRYAADPDKPEETVEDIINCEQAAGKVSIIAELPVKPDAPLTVEGDYGPFEFEVYEWEKEQYTRLKRKDPEYLISSARGFDSAVLTDNGILFSQSEKLSREAGLWYFANEQLGGPSRICDYVRIWQ